MNTQQQLLKTGFRHWRLALKSLSVLKIILPLLVGLGMAYQVTKVIDPLYFGLTLLFGCLVQIYLYFLNQYTDASAEILPGHFYHRRRDTAGRPVIFANKKTIFRAGLMIAAVIALSGLSITLFSGRVYALPLFLFSLIFINFYSFQPFHLNHRGMGEVLEVLWTGAILPFIGYHLYGASLHTFPFYLVIPIILMSAAGALFNGIKHFPTDLIAGRKTFPVLFGTTITRSVIIGLMSMSIALCAAFYVFKIYNLYALLFGTIIPFFYLLDALRVFHTATHEHLTTLTKFKRLLNYTIYCTHLGLFMGFLAG